MPPDQGVAQAVQCLQDQGLQGIGRPGNSHSPDWRPDAPESLAQVELAVGQPYPGPRARRNPPSS